MYQGMCPDMYLEIYQTCTWKCTWRCTWRCTRNVLGIVPENVPGNVLGNVPEEGIKHNGNKVAFMGQIPVKVMGSVNTGDFIVAHGSIPGYGRAVQ